MTPIQPITVGGIGDGFVAALRLNHQRHQLPSVENLSSVEALIMATRRPNPHLSDPRSWYQLERWRRLRRHQLRVEPLCRMCWERRGVVMPATVAGGRALRRGWKGGARGPK
jgi:hypothetical protein